jgi:SAM-dependent methyltransferase
MSKPRPRTTRRGGPRHYEGLHQTSVDYQQNNWLIEDLPRLVGAGGTSIVEVGCGNGLFLERAAKHWQDVTGVDWVRSPILERVLTDNPSIRFVQHDVVTFAVERPCDLLVSADVLEHLSPAALPTVISRLHAAARCNYHKIACYDDGHSHLSVFGPRAWLRLFESAAPDSGYRIVGRGYRDERRKKSVVISNLDQGRPV